MVMFFYHIDCHALESAMFRALSLWYNHPKEFHNLVLQGMSYDYSWNHSGEEYMEIYKKIQCI